MNNEEYKSPIIVPDGMKLLNLKPDEEEALKAIKVQQGMTIEEGGAAFTGFVTDVDNYVEVNAAYEWVKYYNTGARHIICTCVLPGDNVLETQAYEDDEEHGAGRRLLDYLTSTGATNHAVFVTREYNGKHIGPIRFECMINAAKAAINQKPYNEKSQNYQFSWRRHGRGRGGSVAGGRELKHIDQMTNSDFEKSSDDEELMFNRNGQQYSEMYPAISPLSPSRTQLRPSEVALAHDQMARKTPDY